MNEPSTQDTPRQGNNPILDFLHKVRTSQTDRILGGVCGGFGEHTPIPTWAWRAGFLISVPFGGVGLFAYAILWIFLPREEAAG